MHSSPTYLGTSGFAAGYPGMAISSGSLEGVPKFGRKMEFPVRLADLGIGDAIDNKDLVYNICDGGLPQVADRVDCYEELCIRIGPRMCRIRLIIQMNVSALGDSAYNSFGERIAAVACSLQYRTCLLRYCRGAIPDTGLKIENRTNWLHGFYAANWEFCLEIFGEGFWYNESGK
eukprot:2529276-Rhodomonas_salina.1